jgi:hypothetical protein
VETASYLVTDARGRGFGQQMRAAVLALAFDHLGALRLTRERWRVPGRAPATEITGFDACRPLFAV